jgi:hypothetical protein
VDESFPILRKPCAKGAAFAHVSREHRLRTVYFIDVRCAEPVNDKVTSMTSIRFTRSTSKVDKLASRATPLSIRSSIPLDPSFEERIRTQLANRVGHGAGSIERATVRFEDANGPRGGVDTICRIKVVVKGRPSVLTEKRDTSVGRAFAHAVDAIGIAIARAQDKRSR